MTLPDLLHTLHGRDFGFLKMVAGLWGIELDAPNVRTALPRLVDGMLNGELVNEISAGLPATTQEALFAVAAPGGLLPWAQFARAYGEVRSFGAAKRDRERPDLNPRTPAEMLWYYGLIGKAFLDLPPEPQEFAFIPSDLLTLLELPDRQPENRLGRPASPGEMAALLPATDRILDNACTLLAALRMRLSANQVDTTRWDIPWHHLEALLISAGLLDGSGLPLSEPVRQFLEASRGEALAQLAVAWQRSTRYNELRLLPGLIFEGDWANDPLQTRTRLLEHLSRLPQESWWSLAAFTAGLQEHDPDFQRPAGDYDSWFIRRQDTDQYLRGFSTWNDVDGEVVAALIRGPLHWLGLLDLASPVPGTPATAFHASAWAEKLWMGQPPDGLAAEEAQLTVYSSGKVEAPRLLPRATRYQLSRFCDWQDEKEDGYQYHITPASLEHAREQGLRPAQLIGLLKKHNKGPLPPTLVSALERWEQYGSEARVEMVQILRVARPEILTALRKVRASRFLGEELAPTAVLLKPGGQDAILQALAELGYLGEARLSSDV